MFQLHTVTWSLYDLAFQLSSGAKMKPSYALIMLELMRIMMCPCQKIGAPQRESNGLVKHTHVMLVCNRSEVRIITAPWSAQVDSSRPHSGRPTT